MKLSVLQENLNKGLATVSRAVATRPTLPIISNILLATDQSRLKLCATNLEMAITCWVGAKVEKEGSITIPARLLTEFVGSLPAEKIELALAQKSMELSCGRFSGKISGIPADDFPPIPQIGDGINTKIDVEHLREGISQVAFAAATEESRPVLTGVHADFDGAKLKLAAADGFRLAVYQANLQAPVKNKTAVIIPAKTLSELNRLLADQQDPVDITINQQKGQILFGLKNVEMMSQLLTGNFPNYQQLIPQNHQTHAVIDVNQFNRAVRMASIFARDGSGIVRLVLTPGGAGQGKLNISARAEEIGENMGEIDALVDGEEAKIAFNAKYLTDVLSVIKQPQVSLDLTTPSSPGLIRPSGSDNYIHVIMPMFVQW